MHYSVQKTAIVTGNILRKIMRFIQMIVPQKRRTLDQLGFAFDSRHHRMNRHRVVSAFRSEAGEILKIKDRL